MRNRFCCLLMLPIMLFSLLFFCWGGCSSGGDVPKREYSSAEDETAFETLKIVATIFPLTDILENIGGTMVEVTTLLPAGATPHTYEPTVEQVKKVAEADLLVFVGGGLDNWSLNLAAAAEEGAVVEIMSLMEAGEVGDYAGRCENHDPHLWLDPVLVKEIIAPLLTEELKRIRPGQKEFFAENLKIFQVALEELHSEIAATIQNLSGARFISYHSAWNYFARRYGLQELAVVVEFPGQEPSGKWLAELIKLAKIHHLKIIFAEPQLNSKVAEVIAQEIGGRVFSLDPLGGKGLPGKDSYLELMRYNTKIFKEALH